MENEIPHFRRTIAGSGFASIGMTRQFYGRGGRSSNMQLELLNIKSSFESPLLPPHIQLLNVISNAVRNPHLT